MPLHHHRNAPADTKRPEPTAAETRPLSTRLSLPRAAMNRLLVQLRAHHHALRCRGLASSTFVRSHAKLPAAIFSHTPHRHEHGLTFTRSRRMRSMGERSAFFQAIPPRRKVLFSRIVIALFGGPSGRSAATRTGSVWVLLERNPPNRPLVPAGTPALRRESNPAPQN